MIVTNLNMPRCSGAELCRRLKADAATRHIPVLIVTGAMFREQDLLDDGCDRVLTKPITAQDLTEAVMEVAKRLGIDPETGPPYPIVCAMRAGPEPREMTRSNGDTAKDTAPPDPRTATPLHVLLVEDDAAFAEFLLTALSASGRVDLRLTRVGRLRAALEVIHQDGVEAVLLDLNLPDSRGLATLTQITTAAPHMAVVVLTGVDDARLATEALRRGARNWLTRGTSRS